MTSSSSSSANGQKIDALLKIMARLRDPKGGCPWDLEQTFKTIAPYTIEEAYEVADAIEQDDPHAIKDELGDLLFQVVFHSQMAQEAGHFDFNDVADAISDKMIRRHPHVFADAAERTADGQVVAWEDQKAAERAAKGKNDSLLDDVPTGLPALTRAVKLQKRAARVGFDWSEAEPIFAKLDEEVGELKHEMANGGGADRLEDEVGDVLFVVANICRHLGVDPESALRSTNSKFNRRFREVEKRLVDQGSSVEDAGLEEMETLWQTIKQEEHALKD